MKKYIVNGAIIFTLIGILSGGFIFADIIVSPIIGGIFGAIAYSFKASSEIRKRKKQVYPLTSALDVETIQTRILSNLKYEKLKEVKIESHDTLSIYTSVGMYELKISGSNLKIVEYPILSKAIIYKLLFRGAPQIILNNEAKILIPKIYTAINESPIYIS